VSNPWFRLYAEFATDPVVQSMSFDDQRHFVVILCLKCSGVLDREFGDPQARIAMLRRALGLESLAFDEAKNRLCSSGLIDGNWQPKNWEKRQFASDHSAAERMRHYRQRNRYVTVTSSVTKSDVLDTDTDTDTDKNIGQTPSAFDRFWKAYPKKVKRKTAEEIWRRKRLDPRIDQLIADVTLRLASDSRWQGGYVPDPTTYLNQERWNDELQQARTQEEPRRGLPVLRV